jgi:hypothetical protein
MKTGFLRRISLKLSGEANSESIIPFVKPPADIRATRYHRTDGAAGVLNQSKGEESNVLDPIAR